MRLLCEEQKIGGYQKELDPFSGGEDFVYPNWKQVQILK